MKIESPAWYCARTKPKHEHIAAANLRKNLNLEVFHPRLRMERATRRGVMRVSEPLFPCYIFFRCFIEEKLGEIQHTSGISTVVHFARRIPKIADAVIEELKECFEGEETLTVEDRLSPGDEVVVVDGAFAECAPLSCASCRLESAFRCCLMFWGVPRRRKLMKTRSLMKEIQ